MSRRSFSVSFTDTLKFVINYNPDDMSVELIVKAHVPIIGAISIAKGKGSLKQGVVVKLNYKGMVTGEASVKLPENSAILYYNINAFGTKLKDSLALFSV